jgi:ABC-type antimicrobial peptide transport system permease subunit
MSDPFPEFYLSMDQVPDEAWEWEGRTMTLAVRRAGSIADAVTAMRAAVREVDPGLPLYGVTTLEEALRASTAQARFHTLLLGLLGLVGLVLAAVGIYGVMSYAVAQRAHEMGVRMALGAQRQDLLKLVVGQSLRRVGLGLLLGLALALAAHRSIAGLLYATGALDVGVLTAVPALLAGVALFASWLPARRAAGVDPAVVLRRG